MLTLGAEKGPTMKSKLSFIFLCLFLCGQIRAQNGSHQLLPLMRHQSFGFSGTEVSNANQLMTALLSGNLTAAASESFSGARNLINANVAELRAKCLVDGSVITTIVAALSCAGSSGSIEIMPGAGTLSIPSNVTIPSGVALAIDQGAKLAPASGVKLTINGPIVAGNYQIFEPVGSGTFALGLNAISNGVWATWYWGSDIGTRLNNLGATMPNPSQPTIWIPPGPDNVPSSSSMLSCWDTSTTVAFTTAGIYPSFRGIASGVCLNYTPISGTFFSLDYVPAATQAFVYGHGFRDIALVNNKCFTTGGCGTTALGIVLGNNNRGAADATYQNVSLIGWNQAFVNNNTNNIALGTWINPFWEANNDVFVTGTCSPCVVSLGGSALGNTSVVQSTASTGGEYYFTSLQMATNIGPVFDFSRSTQIAFASWTNSHFEDSPSSSSASPHFITGLVDARIYGGTMETDQTSGTQDEYISIASGGVLTIHGLELSSGGKSLTQAFLLNGTARGNIQVTNISPTAIPTLVNGMATLASVSVNAVPAFESGQFKIDTGVSNDQGGVKHKRFGATCSTGNVAGNTCATTYSWATAFADANYTPVCWGEGPSGTPILTMTKTQIAGSITVQVQTAGAVSSAFAGVYCIAAHD